jgi:biopolymer transport protein ExbB
MFEGLRHQCLLLEECIRQGGPIMVPLLLVSLVMWLLIFERVIVLGRLYRRPMHLAEALALIRQGKKVPAGGRQGVVGLLVSQFLGLRSGDTELDRFILDESVLTINHRLGASLTAIGVLAAIAPLLGLLGTVLGMIATFDVLSVFGTGNSKAMAGGISEALVTTQTGLLVAIPGLYMKHFLGRRATTLQERVAAAGMYLRRQL